MRPAWTMVAVANCWPSDANLRRHHRDADRANGGGAIVDRRARSDAMAIQSHGAIDVADADAAADVADADAVGSADGS